MSYNILVMLRKCSVLQSQNRDHMMLTVKLGLMVNKPIHKINTHN